MMGMTTIDKTLQSGAIQDNPDNWITRRVELQVLESFNNITISKKGSIS